jgi:hypothetical protein
LNPFGSPPPSPRPGASLNPFGSPSPRPGASLNPFGSFNPFGSKPPPIVVGPPPPSRPGTPPKRLPVGLRSERAGSAPKARPPSRGFRVSGSPLKFESPIRGGVGLPVGLRGDRAVASAKVRPPSRLAPKNRTPPPRDIYSYVGTLGPTSQPPAYPIPSKVFPSTFGPIVVPDDGSTSTRRRRRPRAVGWTYRSPPRRQSYRKKLATRRRCRDVLGRFVRC